MSKISQFVDKSRGASIKSIKAMVKDLLKREDINNVYTALANGYDLMPLTMKTLIIRELQEKELGYCSVKDYLISKYVIFSMVEKENSTTIDLILKLVVEIIGIKMFKIDVREYQAFNGKYEKVDKVFDQVSLNYKKKEDAEYYSLLVEEKVIAEKKSGKEIDETTFALVCDMLDSLYFKKQYQNMILRSVGMEASGIPYFAGKELFIEDIAFSKRNSINPSVTTIKVFERKIKIKEAIIDRLHFIIASSDEETVVIDTRIPTTILVKDVILFASVLQYYKLKDSDIVYSMLEGAKDDNKVTRINRKPKSREEMLEIQEKWNFSIGEDETVFRKALLG